MSSSFDTRSCHSEPSSSSTSSVPLVLSSLPRPRQNEHLAVLIPKRLWKPDSQAAHCDTFLCRKVFSIWERRHHCRKCGGVFCADCSSRTTPLLDTSNLTFLHPPRNVPIFVFNSPESPVVDARVCDACWDQIHGCKSPRSPVIAKLSSPIALVRDAEGSVASDSSSVSSSSLNTPPEGSPLSALPSRPLPRRTHPTSPRIPASPLRPNTPVAQSIVGAASGALISDSELSLGELDAYPLKRASSICKATGGGRWEPKPVPTYIAKRVPGCKTEYELELEREEEERRRRRANPVIKDGDFQLRVPREIEPRSPAGPITLSTF
ncbi:FYVE-domain-containing protein [Trametes coccinea BRFM310]|uniref:FYVE-domain-containing protein n=1 Tax=Trametes coccinea (strain BRFM310) TaxID=1353009 RepID=A0A1Y2IX02_TRAC3|nr:FYVE-domain-containing protein [Trametes coccinea BRFM310]